jgi:hypothetical protein
MKLSSVVANSTFPDVIRLAGQHSWYYDQPGAAGIVNRSFERLRILPLETRVARLIGEHRNATEEQQSPSAALAELASTLEAIVVEGSDSAEQARAAYLVEEWRRISSLANQIDAPPALFSFLRIEAFAMYFNLAWLTIA